MKKLKYLFFIIPLLFVFIGNTKAFTFLEDNGIVYNEEYVYNAIKTQYPNFDYSNYNQVIGTLWYTNSSLSSINRFDVAFYPSNFVFPSFTSDYTQFFGSDVYYFSYQSGNINLTYYDTTAGFGIFVGRYNRYSHTNFEINYCYFSTCVQNDLDFSFALLPEEPEDPVADSLTQVNSYISYELAQSSRIFDIFFSNSLLKICILILVCFTAFLFTFKIIKRR